MTKPPAPRAPTRTPTKGKARPRTDFPIRSEDTSENVVELENLFRAAAFYINTTNVMQGPDVIRIGFGESSSHIPTQYHTSVAMSFGSARALARSIIAIVGDEDEDEDGQ